MTRASTILLADGLSMVDDQYRSALPAERLADGLGRLLDDASKRLSSGGLLLLSGTAASLLQLPKHAPKPHTKSIPPAISCATRTGWTSKGAELRPWTRFTKDGQTIILGVLDWMTADRMPMLEMWPEETAANLVTWQRHAGTSYWGTPGVAGTALLRSLHAGKKNEPRWQPRPPRGLDYIIERDLNWQAPSASTAGLTRQTYDTNAMYLAAESAGLLPVGALERQTSLELDRTRAGLHLIETQRWAESRIPAPAAWGMPDGPMRMWVATPTLILLDDLAEHGRVDAGYVIREQWTAPARRLMRPWAEIVRDMVYPTIADTNGAPIWAPGTVSAGVRTAAKAAYRETWGMLAREGGRIFRPDWASIILAHARCTLWRKLWAVGNKQGLWPTEILTDAVTYLTRETDPILALPAGWQIGSGLGKWKIK